MVHVTAAQIPGQGHASLITCEGAAFEAPPQWEHTPPSSLPLVIHIRFPWEPTSCRSMPGNCTFAMPKREAATLAVSLNQRIIDLIKTRPESERAFYWNLVCVTPHGFVVCRLAVQDFRPTSPYDLPADAWPLVAPNVVVRCAAQDFNRRQMEAAGPPRYWCLAVKRISMADLLAADEPVAVPDEPAAEGGAA